MTKSRRLMINLRPGKEHLNGEIQGREMGSGLDSLPVIGHVRFGSIAPFWPRPKNVSFASIATATHVILAQLGEPRFAPLRDKEHLADVASILDEVMRLRRIIKLEARCHLRSDDTACRKLH